MQTAIKQRPILFSTDMVQAILAGRKTMTRRKLRYQPEPPRGIYRNEDAIPILKENGADLLSRFNWRTERYPPKIYQDASFFDGKGRCPYGKVGDILWVRETFVRGCEWDGEGEMPPMRYWYRADNDCPGEWYSEEKGELRNTPWKPSIFMPYAICRLFLRITDIRVERLQDIPLSDVKKEGCINTMIDPNVLTFKSLWESINGAESWVGNPFVWVISFERIDKPE